MRRTIHFRDMIFAVILLVLVSAPFFAPLKVWR
jgi:hypothetical protein